MAEIVAVFRYYVTNVNRLHLVCGAQITKGLVADSTGALGEACY